VVRKKRVPASIICAAGAALAAIKRDVPVTVVNFSSWSFHYRATRDVEVIYQAIAKFQGEATILPKPGPLRLRQRPDRPVDYVLVSDGAIQNLEQVMPRYAAAIRAHPDNRAIVYALGTEASDAISLIGKAGFEVEQVERPDRAFIAYALHTLKKTLSLP
jgi:hypothetical protein